MAIALAEPSDDRAGVLAPAAAHPTHTQTCSKEVSSQRGTFLSTWPGAEGDVELRCPRRALRDRTNHGGRIHSKVETCLSRMLLEGSCGNFRSGSAARNLPRETSN